MKWAILKVPDKWLVFLFSFMASLSTYFWLSKYKFYWFVLYQFLSIYYPIFVKKNVKKGIQTLEMKYITFYNNKNLNIETWIKLNYHSGLEKNKNHSLLKVTVYINLKKRLSFFFIFAFLIHKRMYVRELNFARNLWGGIQVLLLDC